MILKKGEKPNKQSERDTNIYRKESREDDLKSCVRELQRKAHNKSGRNCSGIKPQ